MTIVNIRPGTRWQVSSRGVTPAELDAAVAVKQSLDSTLTGLSGLDAGAGLVEQTGADTFTKRALGVDATTSVPTRADADARYAVKGTETDLDAAETTLAALLGEIITARSGLGTLDLRIDGIAAAADAVEAEVDGVQTIINWDRPADNLKFFTHSITGGDVQALAPIDASELVWTDEGQAVKLTDPPDGVDYVRIAVRHKYYLEPARSYRVRWMVKRAVNAADPINDAIVPKIAWYESTLVAATPAVTTLTPLAYTTGDGWNTISAVIARAAATGVDHVAPAAARFATPFLDAFGETQQTNVVLIDLEPLDTEFYSPDLTALENQIAALESIDSGNRLDVLETYHAAPDTQSFETKADLAAATVGATVNQVTLHGWDAADDGLGAMLARVASGEPAVAADEKAQSADGAWWQVAPQSLRRNTFQNSGAGAQERHADARLRDTVHLLDYIPEALHANILNYTTTDDVIDYIDAAIAAFQDPVGIYGMRGPHILLPRGKIHISRPIQIRCSMTLEGQGGSNMGDQGFPTEIEVEADQHGIIVHTFGTYDETATLPWVNPHPAWNNLYTVYAGRTYCTNDGGKIYRCVGSGVTAESGGPTGTGSGIVDGTATWDYETVSYHVGDRRTGVGTDVNGTYSGIYEVVGVPASGVSSVEPNLRPGDPDTTLADGYTWRFIMTAQGSANTNLSNFALTSLGGTVGHGIWLRASTQVSDVRVGSFPQNGYHINATTSIGTQVLNEGNANRWRVFGGRVVGCGQHGMFVDGSDANAGMAFNVDCSDNGGWGFKDDSFLGNTYIGCHTNDNGQLSKRQYNRFGYYCIDAVLGPTTPPGTDDAVWYQYATIGGSYANTITDWASGTSYVAGGLGVGSLVEPTNGGVYRCTVKGAGTSTSEPTHTGFTAVAYPDGYSWILQADVPIWVSGDTTVVEGGSFYVTVGFLLSCYAEAGQPAHLGPLAIAFFPGYNADYLTKASRGMHWQQDLNMLQIAQYDAGHEGKINMGWGGPTDTDNFTSFTHPVYQIQGLYDFLNRTDGSWEHQTAQGRFFAKMLQATTQTFGRSAPVPYSMFIDKLFLGPGTLTAARQITSATAMPTTGVWAAGDFVWNASPELGEPFAWRCIAAGTPGTWQPLRDTASLQTVTDPVANIALVPATSPYHTLVAGTLTQARSVTLSATGAFSGLTWRITRTAAGAFDLNVGTGPLKALAANTWCEVTYNGSAYYLSAYGAL